jgi:hypothetical protein
MVDTSNPHQNDTAMDTVVPKTEPTILEGSISSAVSTPEAEGEILTQDVAQTQKRKGGRKPVRKINSLSPFLFIYFIYLPNPPCGVCVCCVCVMIIRGPALRLSLSLPIMFLI